MLWEAPGKAYVMIITLFMPFDPQLSNIHCRIIYISRKKGSHQMSSSYMKYGMFFMLEVKSAKAAAVLNGQPQIKSHTV